MTRVSHAPVIFDQFSCIRSIRCMSKNTANKNYEKINLDSSTPRQQNQVSGQNLLNLPLSNQKCKQRNSSTSEEKFLISKF